jgi:hypothetical protein
MTREELQKRLDNAMLLLSEPKFIGVRWMTDVTNSMWHSGPGASWFEIYQPLLKVLYTIGLIGCSKRSTKSATFYSDDPLFIDQESNVEQSTAFFIHRAFHRGLDIKLASQKAYSNDAQRRKPNVG